MTSLKETSIKGLLWDFSGRMGLQGVGFFVTIVLARILAPEDFGILAIITVFINLANVFLDFGFGTALIQRLEVTESHYASVFFVNLGMGLVLATVVFFSAPFLAAFYDKAQLVNLTRVMSLSFIVNSFGNVPRAKLRREMNFKAISVASIFAAGVSGTGAIIMALSGFGVWSLAIQSIANQLLANSFIFFTCRIKFGFRFSFQSLKELWGFGSRIFFSGLADTFFVNADSLVIGKVLNISTLGFYDRAKSFEKFSSRYTSMTIASVLLPGLSSLQNDQTKLKQTVNKIFHLLSMFSFLVCGILLVSGREIITLLFSAKWEPSVIMFQIIISGAFASQIFSIFYNTLLSTGHINRYLIVNFVNKGLLLFNLATLYVFGLKTYLITFTIIRLVQYFMGMIYVSKILNFAGLLYLQTFKYISIYLASLSIALFIRSEFSISNLFVSIVVSSSVFIGVFLLLAFFSRCEGLTLAMTEIIDPLRYIIRKKCLV